MLKRKELKERQKKKFECKEKWNNKTGKKIKGVKEEKQEQEINK